MTSAALHTQSLVIRANEGHVFVFAYEIQYTVLFLCAFYVFPVSWQYIHKTIYGLKRGTLHSVCIVIASECFEWMPEDVCPSLTVPRLYQTTAICSLSLSSPFIHEARKNDALLSDLKFDAARKPPTPMLSPWLLISYCFVRHVFIGYPP